jgi:hypothetical protein
MVEEMCRILAGTCPLINQTIDFETLEKCVWKQLIEPNSKAPGEDGQQQEFCKYGSTTFLGLYWKVINAYLKGEIKLVCERMGWSCGWLHPKKVVSSQLLMSEFLMVACICTIFSLLLKIVDERLDHAMEDYGLIDDTQKRF